MMVSRFRKSSSPFDLPGSDQDKRKPILSTHFPWPNISAYGYSLFQKTSIVWQCEGRSTTRARRSRLNFQRRRHNRTPPAYSWSYYTVLFRGCTSDRTSTFAIAGNYSSSNHCGALKNLAFLSSHYVLYPAQSHSGSPWRHHYGWEIWSRWRDADERERTLKPAIKADSALVLQSRDRRCHSKLTVAFYRHSLSHYFDTRQGILSVDNVADYVAMSQPQVWLSRHVIWVTVHIPLWQ